MKIGKHKGLEYMDYNGIRYSRYSDKCEGHARGEMSIHAGRSRRQVKDYPHIFRVFRLREGVERFFRNGSFYAEEKIDGYNVRIIKFKENLLAVTRGGLICPFTTEWIEFWRGRYSFDEFFAMYPGTALCAEFLGDNPYNSKRDTSLPPGLSFFCFDIMKPDGSFLPVEERYSVTAKLGLPCVKSFGRFTAADMGRLREIMLDLNSTGREGLVMKKPGSDGAIKFVTAASDLADLEQFLVFFYDIEPGFYSNRLMRVSLFVQEFGLDEAEYIKRTGAAVIKGYGALKNYEGSFEDFTVYMHSVETWNSLKKLILKHVDVVSEEPHPETINGVQLYKVSFRRSHKKSTLRYREIISGQKE
ncbi:MAG TPA: RNA ligase [Spirochaetota bacterium]|nr:RNA ligase [Spirochaetota bacterium]